MGAYACRSCGTTNVPPCGAFIGFFGLRTLHPQLCRACTARERPDLLAEWDARVAAEARRREAHRRRVMGGDTCR